MSGLELELDDEPLRDDSSLPDTVRVARWLNSATRICVFTGAGISVASGIPDFRSEAGLWARFDPNECANIQVFKADPMPFWRMAQECDDLVKNARPNAAHAALAALEAPGKRVEIVTQNIDGLHQQAGS